MRFHAYDGPIDIPLDNWVPSTPVRLLRKRQFGIEEEPSEAVSERCSTLHPANVAEVASRIIAHHPLQMRLDEFLEEDDLRMLQHIFGVIASSRESIIKFIEYYRSVSDKGARVKDACSLCLSWFSNAARVYGDPENIELSDYQPTWKAPHTVLDKSEKGTNVRNVHQVLSINPAECGLNAFQTHLHWREDNNRQWYLAFNTPLGTDFETIKTNIKDKDALEIVLETRDPTAHSEATAANTIPVSLDPMTMNAKSDWFSIAGITPDIPMEYRLSGGKGLYWANAEPR